MRFHVLIRAHLVIVYSELCWSICCPTYVDTTNFELGAPLEVTGATVNRIRRGVLIHQAGGSVQSDRPALQRFNGTVIRLNIDTNKVSEFISR